MPEEDLIASSVWAEKADLMVVVGSTCKVYPAADMPRATKSNGGRVVIMNIGRTDLDDICDLRFSYEKVGELLPRLWEYSPEDGSQGSSERNTNPDPDRILSDCEHD